MKFYIADAFTDTLFGGNPAGVVILEESETFPEDEVMRRTAAELRYSETAFIKQVSDKQFNIRYFTPADEVDLCGHATIASFYCMLSAGIVENGQNYINKTLAGDLNISIEDDFIIMDMASPEYISTLNQEADIRELYDIMGIPYSPDYNFEENLNDNQLLPMLISTGLPDIMMPVSTRTELAEISPDFDRLSELSKKYNVVGVHAFTLDPETPDITAHCRNFAPLYDIDEEAATGTSNGALTYYLYKNGLLEPGDSALFIQGEAMNRPSKIISYLNASESNSQTGVKIRVGGSAKILSKGTILL